MESSIRPMSCGNCGNGLFKMYQQPQRVGFVILAECVSCKSVTRIEPRPAELTLEFGEGSDGRLCPMEPKDTKLTATALRNSRERVANSAYDRLSIPGYGVVSNGPWTPDPEKDALSLPLRLALDGSSSHVEARFVVSFMASESAEMQDAYVVIGETTLMASGVSPDALRPSPNRG